MWRIEAVVCLLAAPRVQLSVSASSGRIMRFDIMRLCNSFYYHFSYHIRYKSRQDKQANKQSDKQK